MKHKASDFEAAVLASVSYKDGWSFLLSKQGLYLQVQMPPAGGVSWKGRKWQLSEHMTEGEIVQTALMACLAAEEHEAREAFNYKGKALFGPHLSIEKLLAIADSIEMREPPK